jgi:hypothetical protein
MGHLVSVVWSPVRTGFLAVSKNEYSVFLLACVQQLVYEYYVSPVDEMEVQMKYFLL